MHLFTSVKTPCHLHRCAHTTLPPVHICVVCLIQILRMSVIMECDNILAKLNATNIQKSKDLVIEFTLFLGSIRGKGRNAHKDLK